MLEPITEHLTKFKRKDLAIEVLETFGKYAGVFGEYDELAKCFFKIKEYTHAIKWANKALTTAYQNQEMWVARNNLINVYNHANYPEKAMFHIKICEKIIPDDEHVRLEKAYSHFLLNERDKAEAILRNELKRTDIDEKTRIKIDFNLGTYCLWRDEFQEGLRRFLLEGAKLDYWRKAKLPFKFWEGGAMPGRDIILFAEAGIGDEIINVRFMKHLRELGMNPIWLSDRKDINEIFNANGFTAITSMREYKGENPLWTYPMSLPVYLNLEYKDLWYGPYIKSLEKYDDQWSFIDNDKNLKIGIRYQGNPDYDQDLHRSVPLKGIVNALPKNASLYSLQRDDGLEELDEFPQIKRFEDKMDTFGSTLAYINKMDIIVTSCTSIAHAAAAMGKKTIVITPISAYYTWSYSVPQCPWYGDNVTLLRQTSPRVWDKPMAQLKEILKNENKVD